MGEVFDARLVQEGIESVRRYRPVACLVLHPECTAVPVGTTEVLGYPVVRSVLLPKSLIQVLPEGDTADRLLESVAGASEEGRG